MKNLTRTTLISLVTVTALSLGAWATCDADVDMNEHKITNVGNPENPQDVATKIYVDAKAVVSKRYVDTSINNLNPLVTEQYIRNNNKEIVTDTERNLMWQDNTYTGESNKKLSYTEANSYCSDLNLGNYNDWKVPEYAQLFSLLKEDEQAPKISGVFHNIANTGFYWSSSIAFGEMRNIVNFTLGSVDAGNDESDSYHIRCVREIE